MTNKDTVLRNVAKKDWIKTSFWVPENTPHKSENVLKTSEPIKKEKLYCPVYDKNCSDKESALNKKHQIKMKELISLKFDSEVNEKGKEEYICWVCQKSLVH